MTADDFREMALGLDGVVERAHMGHPDFRANGRIFATLQADERRGMVQLKPEEQRELLRSHPDVFTPASGAWGRGGSTMVQLSIADRSVVRGAMILAWEHTAEKPPPKRRAPASRKPAARRSTKRR